MGIIHIMERGGDDLREYKKAVKMAKEAIDTICELTEEMEDQYGERGGNHMRGSYRRRDEMSDYDERRAREWRGRYM